MTDAELARLARRAQRLDDRIKQAALQLRDIKDEILTEMEKRSTSGITTGGMQITYVAPETVVYDEARLKRSLGKQLWAKCLEARFSKSALFTLVQEGEVPLEKVQRCSEIQKQTPYVRVTPTAEKPKRRL